MMYIYIYITECRFISLHTVKILSTTVSYQFEFACYRLRCTQFDQYVRIKIYTFIETSFEDEKIHYG